MPTLEVSVHNDSNVVLTYLALRFVPSRTTFLQVRVARDSEQQVLNLHTPSGLTVAFQLTPGIAPNQPVRLLLDYHGEPPALPIAVVPFTGLPALHAFAPESLDWRRAWEGAIDALDDQARNDERARAEQCAATIAQRHSHLGRAAQFFLALDFATNTVLLPRRHVDLGPIKTVQAFLIERLFWRLGEPGLPSTPPTEVSHLSRLQSDIVTTHYSKGGSFDFASFEHDFVSFALGHLQCGEGQWNARPNSAFFFLFAEFAFAAIEVGVPEASLWADLAPVFVRAQILYTRVFAPYCTVNMPRREVPIENRRWATYNTQPEPTSMSLDDAASLIRAAYPFPTADLAFWCSAHLRNACHAFPRLRIDEKQACALV